MNRLFSLLGQNHQPVCLFRRGFWAFVLFSVCVAPAFGQTLFLDFNTSGQFVNNFNIFGTSNWAESTTGGVGGSGGVNVTASNDSTVTYKTSSWNFSTNGAVMNVAVMVKANAQTSGNKLQLGIINVINNGFNANAGT